MNLMSQIAEILKPFDEQTLNGIIESIPQRRESMDSFRENNRGGARSNPDAYYRGLFDAVGGKGWYELLQWGDKDLIEKIIKSENMKVETRNFKIAKKLEGIESVVEGTQVYSTNGFEGTWEFVSETGKTKRVTLEVILAGGYNIQCLHNRVLVKVK